MRLIAIGAMVVAAAVVSTASAAQAVVYVASEAVGARVTPPADSATAALRVAMLADRGHHSTLAIRRAADGEAEVHAEWDDVFVVREGRGTLVSGGRVEGGRPTGPGEWRGGEIAGGVSQALAAGDVVVIPAGIPHQVRLAAGETIVYVVVKVRRPASPPQD